MKHFQASAVNFAFSALAIYLYLELTWPVYLFSAGWLFADGTREILNWAKRGAK